jgi:hypothetical protein
MPSVRLVTKSFPMFIGSIGLFLIATGWGNLTFAPLINEGWHAYQNLTHQPLTNLVDTAGASGLINWGIFFIILAAICYIAPYAIAAARDRY